MRPKKRILLIDANEHQLGAYRFMLQTNGYAVISAVSADEALVACRERLPEGVMIMHPLSKSQNAERETDQLLGWLRTLTGGQPALVVALNAKEPPRLALFSEHLLSGKCYASEILERLRLLTARKRGPRKGVGCRFQPGVVPVEVELPAARIA